MFTGLIEERGTVRKISKERSSILLTIEAQKVLAGINLGESIAVNGVCLTVTSFTADTFTADVMPETLDKTNLGLLAPGNQVNLERALQVGGRLGGHLVTGHVDATGEILHLNRRGIAVEMWVRLPSDLDRFLIPQGSVALDGVSLTVAELKPDAFMVSLIPHTRRETTLGSKKVGDIVNIEADLLGKYVCYLAGKIMAPAEQKGITPQFLAEHGFI